MSQKILLASTLLLGANAAGECDPVCKDGSICMYVPVFDDKCVPDLAGMTGDIIEAGIDAAKEIADGTKGVIEGLNGQLQAMGTISLGADLSASAGLEFATNAEVTITELKSIATDAIIEFKDKAKASITDVVVSSEELILELQADAQAILAKVEVQAGKSLLMTGDGSINLGSVTGSGTLDVGSWVKLGGADLAAGASIAADILANIGEGGVLDLSANAAATIGKLDLMAGGSLLVAVDATNIPTVAEFKACAGTIKVEFEADIPSSGTAVKYTGAPPSEIAGCVLELVSNAGVVVTIDVGASAAVGRRLMGLSASFGADGNLSFELPTPDEGCTPECMTGFMCHETSFVNFCAPDLDLMKSMTVEITKDLVEIANGVKGQIAASGSLQMMGAINLGAAADATAGLSFDVDCEVDIEALTSAAKDAIIEFGEKAKAELDSLKVQGEELVLDLKAKAEAILDSVELSAGSSLLVSGDGAVDIGSLTGSGTLSVDGTVNLGARVAAGASIAADILAQIQGGGVLDISANAAATIGDLDLMAGGSLVVSVDANNFPTVDEFKACAGTIKVEFEADIPNSGTALKYTGAPPSEIVGCALELISGAGVTIKIDAVTNAQASGRRLLGECAASFDDGSVKYSNCGGSDDASGATAVVLPSVAILLAAAVAI